VEIRKMKPKNATEKEEDKARFVRKFLKEENMGMWKNK
jgi:hypothetical protein